MTGLHRWELGFEQSSLHHIARVLRSDALRILRFTDMLSSPLVFSPRLGPVCTMLALHKKRSTVSLL